MVTFPWRRYQQFCLGVLHWTPDAFWRATVWDVTAAYEGYALANGLKKDINLPSDKERKALRAREEREKWLTSAS